MPNGRRGGYGSYGGRSNYQYDNRQPAAFQYQSFYDPIPVESLIGSSQRSQQEYDVGYAGALAAQDELAQSLVGMRDIEQKNKILNESIANMNKTVEEKFGGDWGRASKDIAAQVTQVRSNPYWNMAKQAEARREETREIKLKYPDAFVFNDPTQISVVDEEGRLRGAEAFTPDIVQRGDYNKTSREIMSMVVQNAGSFGLSRVEAAGLDHYVQTGEYKDITADRIEELASDPDVQELFLGRHTELRRAEAEMTEEQKQRHGLAGKTAAQFAKEQLLGAGKPLVHRQVDLDFSIDTVAAAAKKAAITADVPMTPTTNANEVIGNHYVGKKRPRDVNFNADGGIASATDRVTARQEPTVESMMPVFTHYGGVYPGIDMAALAGKGVKGWQQIMDHVRSQGVGPHNPLGTIVDAADSVQDFAMKVAARKDNEYMEALYETNPKLNATDEEGNRIYTPERAYNLKLSADEKLSQESSTLYNYGIDWQEAETQNFVFDKKTGTPGRMMQQELYLDGALVAGEEKDKLLAKELGYKAGSEGFNEALQSSRISDMSYTGNTPGEYIMTVKDNKGNNRIVEMAPNREVQELSTPSWAITEFVRSNGQSTRLQDYKVGEAQMAPTIDETGALIVPIQAVATIEGKNYPVFYRVENEIVPDAEGSKSGTYQTDITQFTVNEAGEQIVLNEGMSMKDVVNFDKSQVEGWLKSNRLHRQSGI
jgi:hypothetical protein